MRIRKIVQIIQRFLIKKLRVLWQDKYKEIYPVYLRKIGVNIPNDYYENNMGYIDPSVHFDGSDYSLISIGKNTTISRDVLILTHDFSLAKGFQLIKAPIKNAHFLKPVIIGENCFIGARAVLLPGATIGNNCIVGAGSVVRGEVPSGSIVTGNPAKVVRETEEWANYHLNKQDYIQ